MSQIPNKQSFNFNDYTSDFLLEQPQPRVFEFGSGSYWQEMDQQVYQQQQQYQRQQYQQTQQQPMMPQRQIHTKLNDMDVNILTPTIEMDELIIKTEPPDDFNNLKLSDDMCFGGRSHNANAFYRSANFASFANTQPYSIKAEPTARQEKHLNFPRRKLQTERSETLPICQRCKQVFLKKSSYTKHVRHSSCPILEHNFKCLICPMSFMSPEELQAHEYVHRCYRFFCQKYCGKYFDTLDLCEVHEYTFHDFDLFVCNVCMSTYKSQDELFAHKTQHCHLMRFDCPICRRWFTSTHDLRRHYLETPFVCGKFFSDQIPFDKSGQYCRSASLNENNNFSVQDCNEDVLKAPITKYGNLSHDNFGLHNGQGNNHIPSTLNIKIEPIFDQTDPYYQNPYDAVASNFNVNCPMAPYSDFNNSFQMMERRYLDSFNFPSTYIPATPAVNEVDAICCVPNCGLRKSVAPTHQFFKFPKDLKYLKQWLHNMKLIFNPSESYEDYRICSQHFPKRVINLHSLCYWAVPTYHLGHDDTANIFHNRDQNYHTQPKCSMPGCDSQRGKTNLKFFSFPTSDNDVYIKWCQNTRLSLHSNETRQLCSRHFEDQCFGKIRLKVWAVPTLHLGGNPRIHDNPPIPVLEVKKCCLPHCRRKRSEDPSLSLYSFPKDELLFQRWCHNLKLHPMEYRGKFHKVCSSHFVKDVVGSMKLHSGAVPTLNLGHNDPNIYDNEIFTMTSTPSKSSLNFNCISPSSFPGSTMNFDTPDTCSLPSCKRNRYIDNVTMHTMPGRPEMLQKWCHNIKMNPQKIPKYFRLCSIHFEPYCIGGCMRPFAVPTRHLGHDDQNIYHNPKVIKKLHIRETCCVLTCRRNRERDKANLHRFPLHKPDLLQKWLDNLRRPMPDGTRLFNDSICERHFDERCIRNKRLERWAIPTLKLGHNEDIIHLPTEAEVENLYARQINPTTNSNHSLECCVESCRRNPKTDDVKLYCLPEDEAILEKWSHNLQKDLRATPSVRICNLHFETRCISKRLQPWALPTLNLPHSSPENLYQNPKETKSVSASKLLGYAPRCCLPHCRKQRSDGKVQLFRFPSYSKSMLKKWCHNLQISTPVSSASHRRVCSSHFEPHVLTKRCPRPNSVPTLALNCPAGYKIYQNPERLKLAKLRTQRLCVIPNCRKSISEGVQLFLYPHNRTMLRKWAHNTKQKAGECSRGQLRICSEHFESNCFGPVRLCPGAIPTLKLGHDDTDIFPNKLPSLEEQETRCIIADCKRSRIADAIKLFRFPVDDEDLLWKWCNNLKLNPADSAKSHICNIHFDSDCVGPRGLFRWAIPTLLLGHDDSNQQLHFNPKPHERINTEQIFKCCVAQCGRTRKYDEVQLNSFPKTREHFSRWMHNLRINGDFSVREKYRICNAHFEPQCIGKQRLNLGAIPTLELGHDSNDIYQVDASKLHPWYTHKRPRLSLSIENLQTAGDDFLEEDTLNRCSYTGCSASKSAQRESYTIPKHSTLQKLWCEMLKVSKESLGRDAKLCGLHFIEIYQATDVAMNALQEIHPDINDQLQRLTAAYEQCCSSSLTRSMQCTVPNCKTTSLNGKGLKLYQFPYNRELCEKWCFNTTVKLDTQRRHLHKVCTLHFEHHCLSEAQRLRPWAIPTLHLPPHPSKDKLYLNPDLVGWNRRQLGPQSNKCCVPTCVNNIAENSGTFDSIKLYNFPTDSCLIDKWLHNLRSCVERDKCPLYKICWVHFEKKCISKMARLRPWAIPTLELGFIPDDDKDFKLFDNPNRILSSSSTTIEYNESSLIDCKTKNVTNFIKCCVASCQKILLRNGIRFLDFPVDTKILRRWCFNLQLPLAVPKNLQHICHQHFEKRCFINNKKLHSWAIPTLNLGQNLGFELYKNPKNHIIRNHSSRRRSGRYLPQCCVPGCGKRRTKQNNLQTFGFPKEQSLMKQWCIILQLETVIAIRGGRVCEEHFAPDDRFKLKLKRGVLPTRQLPPIRNKSSPERAGDIVNTNVQFESIDGNLEHVTFSTKTKRCCITNCCNHRGSLMDNVHLFPFPKTEQLLLRKWCHNTQTLFKKRLRLQICSIHFESESLLNGKPLCWAIPTLHLGHRNPIYYNPTIISHKKKCRISDCGAFAPVQLFSYPRDRRLLQKWAHNTKQDAYLALRLNYKVCSRHFETKCIKPQGGLNLGAIPTLHLGHLDTKIHPNNMEPYKMNREDSSASKVCSLTVCHAFKLLNDELFDVPQNKEIRQWWSEEGLKVQMLDTDAKLCALHFMIGYESVRQKDFASAKINSKEHLYLTKIYKSIRKSRRWCMFWCCARDCNIKAIDSSDIELFKFPQDVELYQKWCYNIGIKPEMDHHDYRVCAQHFELKCFDNSKLHPLAVPTLKLNNDSIKFRYNNDKILNSKQQSEERLNPICCIQNCLNGQLASISSNGNTKFWKFPRTERFVEYWCHNIGVNVTDSKNLFVCGVHFEPYCFGKTTLRPWAIPTLLLGHDGVIDIYRNPQVKDLSATQQSKICCVYDCRQQRDDEVGIKLFKFPQNRQKLEKWLNNLKLPEELDGRTLRICSLHFERSCYRTSRICSWAIPTLNLGHDDHSIITKNPKLRQRFAKCCLTHCRKNRRVDTNIHLHNFPKIEDMRDKWLHNLNLTTEYVEQQSTDDRKLCSAHFEKVCFSGSRLKSWAVPTLDLGHTSGAIYENPEQPSKSSTNSNEGINEDFQQCCVPSCSNITNYEDLFGFPADEGLLKKWCENLDFENIAKYRRTKCRICAKHFPSNALRNNSYLPEVVPTLLLGHDKELKHRNPLDLNKYYICSLQLDICLTSNASRESSNFRIFECPKHDATLWKKWCSNLRLDQEQAYDFMGLCAVHFMPEVIVGNKLKPGAVPTLHLGHSLPPTYTNSFDLLNLDRTLLCTVINCTQTDGTYLIDFPTEPMLLAKWCANLKLSPQGCLNKKICSAHFETIGNGQSDGVTQGALPILNLGHFEQLAYDDVKISEASKVTVKCCVSSCARNKTESMSNIQLYQFPKISWLLRKWCYNLRMSAIKDVENLRICSEHFEKHDLSQTQLKPWALPTQALGHQQHIHTSIKLNKYRVLKEVGDEIQSNYCAIVSCLKSSEDSVQLFRYPKDTVLARKWAENCKHDVIEADRYSFRICSVHFDEHCLQRGDVRLRPGSIPTVLLGHIDKNINHHGFGMFPVHTNNMSVTSSHLECCAPGCGCTVLSDNVRLFPFPKDSAVMEIWCHNLKLIIEKDSMLNKRVCNLHFEERCFSKSSHHMHTHAVPTLLLGHNNLADIIPNPVSFERSDSIVYCCVRKCGKSNQFNGVFLHCFPKNRKMFDHWMHNLKLNLKPLPEIWLYYRVCNDHFEKSCYGPENKLLYGSVPTLNLGHTDIEIIHNIKREMISTSAYEQKERETFENANLEENCSLPDCGRTSRDTQIYNLPKHPELRELWLQSLNLPTSEDAKLCTLHFKHTYNNNYDKMIQLTSREIMNKKSVNEFKDEFKALTEIYSAAPSSTQFPGVQCSVPGCNRNIIKDDIKLYTFPHSRDIFEKWCHNTKIQVSDEQRYFYKVCSLHFESHAVAEPSKRLRPWAVPTLNLPSHTSSSVIIPNPDLKEMEEYCAGDWESKQCCIPSCINGLPELRSDVTCSYYKFPEENTQLYLKWLYNTQLKSSYCIRRYICHRHFEGRCFVKNMLKSWAIPTLSLGHNKANIHRNPVDKLEQESMLDENKDLAENINVKNTDDDGDERNETFFDQDHFLGNPFSTDGKTFLNEEELMNESPEKTDLIFSEYSDKSQAISSETPEIPYSTNNWGMMDPLESICENGNKIKSEPPDDDYSNSDNFNQFKITLNEETHCVDNNFNSFIKKSFSNTKEGCIAQYCRIMDCMSHMGQRNIVLHKLPINPLLRKRWLYNSQILFDARRPWAYKICSRHFDRACYSGQRLLQWAVPTLHLGPKQPATIYPNAQSKKRIQTRYVSQGSRAVKSARFSTKSSTVLNTETEAYPPSNFNFKITAINSISIDSSSTADGDGSLNSTEPQKSMTLTSLSPPSKHSTSHLACSLPSCNRRTNEDFVQLHMLPKDPLLQHKWCHNCRLTPSPHELYTTRVCSYHFEQHCFTRTRRQLKLGSIPTRCLGHQDRNIYRNARSLCESFACCVRGCGRRRLQEHARHFRLPLDKPTLDKWLHNLHMQFNTKRPWIYNVCEVHFEPYCFGKAGSLLQWAIPTLNLGHTNTLDIHLNEPPTGQSVTKDDHYDDDALLLPECSISELNQYKIEDNTLENIDNSSHVLTSFGATQKKFSIYRKCILPHCGNSEKENDSEIKFFHFPNNLELRKKWLFNTKLDINLIGQHLEVMQICEQHFEADVLDINNAILKSFAVPTLKLGHNDNNIYLNNMVVDSEPSIKLEPLDDLEPMHEGEAYHVESPKIPNPLELTKLYHNKMRCFIKHCRLKRGDGIKLFRFPRETELQLQWEHNLKLIYDSRRHQRHFLCNRHFEPELIGRKFLRRGAIPTLDLGHNDMANIYRPSIRPSQRNFSLYTHKTQQQQQSFVCSVSTCRSRETGSDSVLLFTVPEDQKCSEIWRQRLLLDNNFSELLVCSNHFRRDLISHRNLLPNAVPSLHLPAMKSQLWSSSTSVTRKAGPIQMPLLTKSATSITSSSIGCSVPGCCRGSTNINEDNIKIFSKFPDDFELFTKWCFNLKIDPRKYIDGTYNVCSAHFEPNCIGEDGLRIWAIPTLNLGHNDANIHEIKRTADKELKCCLPHCGRSDVADGVLLFNFPKGSLLKKWCRILQIDELHCNSDKKICSIHFTPDSIKDFCLRVGVKPSLHLTPTKRNEVSANDCSESNDEKVHNLEQYHNEDDDDDGITVYRNTFNQTTTTSKDHLKSLPATTDTVTSITYDKPTSSLLSLPNSFEALHQQKHSPNKEVLTGNILFNTVNNGNDSLPLLPNVKPYLIEATGLGTNLSGSDDDVAIIGNLLTEMLEDESNDESF